MTLRYLIINADDFGLSKSVNRGILEAYRNETVSSATLMVNMPGFVDAIRIARAEPHLGVGLHFNLSYGQPISPEECVPSLVKPNGDFSLNVSDDMQSGIQRFESKEVYLELCAQWKRFRRTGLRPTHIDSHHHVHAYDPVYSVVAEFARVHRVPIRKVIRPRSSTVQEPISTQYLIADQYFEGNGMERLLGQLAELPRAVTELVCHPGYVDEDVIRISSWTYVRETELRVFTDPRVRMAIKKARIKRIHFGDLSAMASI